MAVEDGSGGGIKKIMFVLDVGKNTEGIRSFAIDFCTTDW